MRIDTIQDIVTQRGFQDQLVSGIAQRLSRATNGAPFRFTALQKEAFNQAGFWYEDDRSRCPAHMIVQGATSSGKTLVSEMAVIECLSTRPRKKAIILVPLKAMVRERRDHFARDLPGERVYAASSDFQDHDADILMGKYDVAVIVYEKFFAMLSQASNQMLEECGLLVVDELQMLSSETRGPKLEIGIQKVMRHNAELGSRRHSGTYTRIMCLTTCDCKTDSIYSWLTADGKEPLLIRSDSRPVGLEEYVIQVDGTLEGRYIPGERDDPSVEDRFQASPEKLAVTGYSKENKPEQAKLLLLRALLKQVYARRPNAKVLVFVSDLNRTVSTAKYIAQEGILPRGAIDAALEEELSGFDHDEGKETLEALLHYKIAFHNSSLSTAMREFVEKSFSGIRDQADDTYVTADCLNLVVATETLTVGMNMPVDVMILFDTRVPRGGATMEALTSQEYKNFVGRAGRLGQSNCVGQSYVVACDRSEAERYRDIYLNCRMEDITSSLIYAQEDVQAPYYLSLLTEAEPYSIERLNEVQEASFSRKCGGRKLKMEDLMDALSRAALCSRRAISGQHEDDDVCDDGPEALQLFYKIEELGQNLAPYALHLNTCKRLRRYFLNGGYRKKTSGGYEERLQPGCGGIPLDITAAALNRDVYLLDILFTVCMTEEVQRLSQFRLPTGDRNPGKSRDAKNLVLKRLKEMTGYGSQEEQAPCRLWSESRLAYILRDEGSSSDLVEFQAVMRAILLWYWTKGYTIPEIKKHTSFSLFTPIYSGHLARMAETVSYQLDAVYHCSNSGRVGYVGESSDALYALSTRVAYGMPRNLVVIANRHLYGLDRMTVLKIGKAAEKGYDSPVGFLVNAPASELRDIITEQQRSELLALVGRLAHQDTFATLLDEIRKNSVSLPLNCQERDALEQLCDGENASVELLETLFWTLDNYVPEDQAARDSKFFDGQQVKLTELRRELQFAALCFANRLSLNITLCTDGHIPTAVRNRFANAQPETRNILLLGTGKEGLHTDEMAAMTYNPNRGRYELRLSEKDTLECIDIAMTTTAFAALLAQSVALGDRGCDMLAGLLWDLQGAFAPKSISSLNRLLKNYRPQRGLEGQGKLRLLWDHRLGDNQDACDRLFQELERRKVPVDILSWGKKLEKQRPTDGPVVLYLTRDALNTGDSVREFCDRLRRHGYKNTMAFFETEAQFLAFSGDPALPAHDLPHHILEDPVKAAEQIAVFYRAQLYRQQDQNFLIGVSYAHTPKKNGIRPAVLWLDRVVQGLNRVFGEYSILYDQNESCKHYFDRNGAIPATLALYSRCRYFIILDDRHYTDGPNCPKEGKTILEAMGRQDMGQHVWFLRPMNESPSMLFDPQRDYAHAVDLSDRSVAETIGDIKRVIDSDLAARQMPET